MKKIIRYAALCCASFLTLLGGTACGGGNFNPPHTHVFEKTKTVAPTCEEKGYVISKCSCGEESREENAEALGHKLTNCVLDKAGKTTTSCARKDCEQAVSIEKPYAEIFQTNGNTIVGFTEEAKKMYTSIYLPTKIDGVEMTAIGASAFTKNETLVDVVIPQGYVSIGDQAFSNCEKLTYCTLGNSIDSIGAWSFYNSKKLSKVTYIGEKAEWDHVKRGTYWNNATAITDAVCSRDGLSVYSEIALNGKTIDGTMTANFDYAYDKVTGIFTNNSGATKCQGFYPLKATDDYILRVQMGAGGGETDFTIYASESTHLTFRTGTDGHSNQVLFMKANGSWNSETRVGYDLSRFVNLDGNGGVVDFMVVRYNQGLYVYVCDYIDETTGLAMKHETWQLVFSCTTNPNQARFEMTTHDPWGHVITDGKNVRAELKTGVLGVVGTFENAFAFNNFSTTSAKWKISLDDIDEHAAVFVASAQRVAYI